MKYILLSLILIIPTINIHSQSREEIKIEYTNGLEIFNVLKSDSQINYDNEKDYYWYTEYSKVKSTKGGSGGRLLDGNYKFYDENGNLIVDQNYSKGLKHGKTKKWDTEGDLVEIVEYENGETTYWKYHPEGDDGWVEQIGRMLNDGWIKNSYDKYNNLLASQKTFIDPNSKIKELKTKTTIYYPNSEKKKEEYTTHMILKNSYIGKYSKFYENGNVEVTGDLFDPYDNGIDKYIGNIRDGDWKWYKENGELDATEKYKAVIEYWPNGNIKNIYGQYLDEETDNWINHGRFYTYEEDGEGIGEITEYKWGELLEKDD